MNLIIKFRKVFYVLFILLAINIITNIIVVAHQLKTSGVIFEGKTVVEDVGKRAVYGKASAGSFGVKEGTIVDGSIVTFFNTRTGSTFPNHESCLIFNVKIESKENTPYIQYIRYEFEASNDLDRKSCGELNNANDFYHQGI